MQRLYTIRKSIKIGIMGDCRMKDLIEKSAIKKEGKKLKKGVESKHAARYNSNYNKIRGNYAL